MQLKIFLPSNMFLGEEISKLTAEGGAGSFCLLPAHIDFVAALRPGITSYVTQNGEERFLAHDHGILVKRGDQVLMAVRHAVAGELGFLKSEVEKMLVELDEHEKISRSAAARLEAGFLRKFMQLGKDA